MIRIGTVFVMTGMIASGDTLTLRNGTPLKGHWAGADAQQIRFQVNDQVRTVARAEVAQVDFGEPPVPPGPEPFAPAPPAFEQVISGVKIRLEKCVRNDAGDVVCSLTVEALTKDLEFAIGWGQTFIVDGKGMKQKAGPKSIGSSSVPGDNSVSTLLVQNVPTAGELKFRGVDGTVNRIALLNLEFSAGRFEQTTFRNIPIQGN